jgi:hypothetical protein
MARNIVHIMANKKYFDRIFEPNRKKLEVKLGIKLSQPKFTEYLANNNLGINFPKFKMFPNKINKRMRIRI